MCVVDVGLKASDGRLNINNILQTTGSENRLSAAHVLSLVSPSSPEYRG